VSGQFAERSDERDERVASGEKVQLRQKPWLSSTVSTQYSARGILGGLLHVYIIQPPKNPTRLKEAAHRTRLKRLCETATSDCASDSSGARPSSFDNPQRWNRHTPEADAGGAPYSTKPEPAPDRHKDDGEHGR
jgi:hypothetical protein